MPILFLLLLVLVILQVTSYIVTGISYTISNVIPVVINSYNKCVTSIVIVITPSNVFYFI